MTSKILKYLVLTLLVLPLGLSAQDPREEVGYFTNPHNTPFGTVCTNNYSSSVYLVKNGSLEELLSSPGCGSYYTISFDGQFVGLKLVDEDGNQIPAVYDLSTRTIKALSAPARQVGQVSFSRGGRIAFTRGEQLIVIDGIKELSYPIGTYANLAPLSPDGNSVVYNDNDDQLWLLTSETAQRSLISDGKLGYFHAQWSPDGAKILYSSLSGLMRVYDLEVKRTYDLGKGNRPSWSSDSRQVVFYRKEFQGPRLVDADLYIASFDGSVQQRLTSTPDVMEMDPSFINGDSEILFHTYSRRTIGAVAVDGNAIRLQKVTSRKEIELPGPKEFSIKPIFRASAAQATSQLDIPYVHQAYDTPDWFNGDAACAPTAAIMLLAYYKILPPWPTYCSTPTIHYNNWGNYVSTQYQFKEVQYLQRANDPNGKAAWGGYGFMWNGSNHPYTRMANYYTYHGMTAVQTDATPYGVAFAEVTSGHPFTLCVMLTSAGHLVLAHGIGAEPHTFIFNDCWGDKNRGYKNYFGKNVSYDWPGYNNGFQNLVSVEWCIATRYDSPVLSDTVIDDLQFARGFAMQTALPASMTLWKDKNVGNQGHAWYAYTRNASTVDTCSATWTPFLPADGVYEVSAYIPSIGNATDARYQIVYSGGSVTKSINQSQNGDAWVSLGSYSFTKASGGSVRLGDQSSNAGQILAFDAVRWSRTQNLATDVLMTSKVPVGSVLGQNYPNPFNPATTIEFRVSSFEFISLKVFDVLGREVATLVDEVRPAGVYRVHWDASSLPSGVYYCRIQAGAFVESKKMVLMK
ncbi:MAG: T9SS type A sorting domain-containing protein [Ignavibacteriales bacterium]|nr:T9SS type A sorting domain-containing protein [Ignavibacteriales bacterium]